MTNDIKCTRFATFLTRISKSMTKFPHLERDIKQP